MKIVAATLLMVAALVPAQAGPQARSGGHFQHGGSTFRPNFGAHRFVARPGNRFRRHFIYGNGGAIIVAPDDGYDYGDYGGGDDTSPDDTIYQGQATSEDTESLPYATPTTDADKVISPYEPHEAVSVAGIPHGAKVKDPVSNLIFLNP